MPAKPLATKTIRQSATFKATPAAVYDLLMDSKKHAATTDHKASISPKVGGKISAYDGYIEGVNVELMAGKRIVQTWRSPEWPKGHYSEVRFELSKAPGGCKLDFTQTGVPAKEYEELKQGWIDFYWDKMKAYLKG